MESPNTTKSLTDLDLTKNDSAIEPTIFWAQYDIGVNKLILDEQQPSCVIVLIT